MSENDELSDQEKQRIVLQSLTGETRERYILLEQSGTTFINIIAKFCGVYADTSTSIELIEAFHAAKQSSHESVTQFADRIELAALKITQHSDIKDKYYSYNDHIELQRDLNLLESWRIKWGMQFNAAKCNIMRVSRIRLPFLYSYKLSGQVLDEVKDSKYLGVTISDNLDWSRHITTTTTKANARLSFIKRNLKDCPQK